MNIQDKAYELSLQLYNPSLRFCHTAFLFDGNKLLSIGQNNTEVTSGRARYFGKRFSVSHFVDFPFIHSEIDAISKLWGRRRITGKEKLISIRLNSKGKLMNARPCKNCSIILSALNLTRITYSISEGFSQ